MTCIPAASRTSGIFQGVYRRYVCDSKYGRPTVSRIYLSQGGRATAIKDWLSVENNVAPWLQDYFYYICKSMNRGIYRITLLLLATLAFVAHAAVSHHHHEGTVCFAFSSDVCEGHCHDHGKDTCDDECSAKALFTTPQQLSQASHETNDVTVDLPAWAAIAVHDVDVPTAEVSYALSFRRTTPPPLIAGYRSALSLRAPPCLLQ